MKHERCLITLSPLKESERDSGMSKKGVKSLFNQRNAKSSLPFTRKEFVEDKPHIQKGMSISGAQPKLSLVLDHSGNLDVVDNGGSYILKPSPEQFPHLAENEHAIMLCMKELGFTIPAFGLIPFAPSAETGKSELAFIIARYDRDGDKRIHQEQMDGAMSIPDKYGNSGSIQIVSYEQVGQFITSNVDSSLAARRDYFKRVVCAYFLGNNDFHLRNIGIIHPNPGAPHLAPVYDYVSVTPYPSYFTQHLALPLLIKEEYDLGLASGYESGHGALIGYDFIEFAAGFAVKSELAKKYINDILAKKDTLIEIIRNSYMNEEHKQIVIASMISKAKLLRAFDLT